ncbi:hypothetical protein Taro_041926 [Colocasia esculenta]|uniref:Uncharacterized protein n=1 Tax=Colocasia esculenta TaxID=4460 RepID=A0A843WYI8_COLES|nr:hypothetical protein [Colocasia esculenta]
MSTQYRRARSDRVYFGRPSCRFSGIPDGIGGRRTGDGEGMPGKVVAVAAAIATKTVVKAVGEYQYPWREKLA